MGRVVQLRLPTSEPRRQLADRRQEPVRIDSRRSLVDPSRTIKVPVLRRPPPPYDWAVERDE